MLELVGADMEELRVLYGGLNGYSSAIIFCVWFWQAALVLVFLSLAKKL